MPLLRSALMLIALAMSGLSGAFAQGWPDKPIRMIVPYAAGGATDAFARIVGGKLQEQLKVPVVVENRVGAGGNIGAETVARAAPDGNTILFNINGQAISPALYKNLSFDFDRDFIRVTQLVSTATVLTVHPGLPVMSFQELVAYAKAHPNKLNYGSTGIGNALHLTMELLKRETGMDIEMVPFRGDAPLLQSLIAGELQVALIPSSAARAHVDAGTIRAIGTTASWRIAAFPDVPTISEQGLPGFSVQGWMGLFLPAKTPQAIVDRLAAEAKLAVNAAEVAPMLINFGMTPVTSTPAEFDALYRADREKFQRIVREANIPLQD
jgi:tripartite-type tricarboxylate transporter receptor subunit TctC